MPMVRRRKNNIARTLGMYFAEKGKIPTFYEYRSDGSRPKGMAPKFILSNFRDWNNFLTYLKLLEPELYAIASGQKADQPSAVEDAAEVMSKPDPLASLRASTTEK